MNQYKHYNPGQLFKSLVDEVDPDGSGKLVCRKGDTLKFIWNDTTDFSMYMPNGRKIVTSIKNKYQLYGMISALHELGVPIFREAFEDYSNSMDALYGYGETQCKSLVFSEGEVCRAYGKFGPEEGVIVNNDDFIKFFQDQIDAATKPKWYQKYKKGDTVWIKATVKATVIDDLDNKQPLKLVISGLDEIESEIWVSEHTQTQLLHDNDVNCSSIHKTS
jgi:hypothetical protein